MIIQLETAERRDWQSEVYIYIIYVHMDKAHSSASNDSYQPSVYRTSSGSQKS